MLNPTPGIQPQSRHNNRGGRRDPIQHHMPQQYQSRAAAPLYQQPYGANVRPTTHRVLLPQGHHQQMFALPMNAGGIGRGLMQSAPRQSNLFSQHQQMMPSHQYPPHFAAPAFVPGQGTQQPINLLQQHPGQMMPPPQMAATAIPTQSLQTQQQPMMRPQHNPMVVYSAEQQQQQQQQQSGNQQAQQTFAKRKRNAIKIIDPDTNIEVNVGGKDSGSDSNTLDDKTNTGRIIPNPVAEDFKKQVEAVSSTSIEPLEVSEPESDATSASTTAEYLPNAIITKNFLKTYNFVDEVVMAVVQKQQLKKKMASIMLQGLPGAGKSMLLDRLLNRPWQHKPYMSTGISDNVTIVDIRPTSEASVAHLCSECSWVEIDHERSVHSDLSGAIQSTTEMPAAAAVKADAGGIACEVRDNIIAVLREHKIMTMADFQKSSLYIRDTGGQVEFQESLSFLLHGSSIFIFVMRTDKNIEEKNIFQYRTSRKIINEYQSSISTIDALLQFLTTVSAIETTKEGGQGNYLTKRPVVFIVGTHIDLLDTERDSVIRNINEILDEVIQKQKFSHLVHYANNSTKEVMYIVDNTSEKDNKFQFLRLGINQYIAGEMEFMVECPINYLLFCLKLQGVKETTLSIDMCKQLAADVGIKPGNLNSLLQFLHYNIGIIQYYNKKDLSNVVIKEPQILLNKLTDLLVKTFLLPGPIVKDEQTSFCQKGILETSAIKKIICESKDKISPEQFLAYLIHLRMAVPFTDKHGVLKYFIPLVLNHVQNSSSDERKTEIAPLGIYFQLGHCPKGLFAMLISHLLNPDEPCDFSFDLVEDEIYQDQVSLLVHSTEDVDEVTLKKRNSCLEIEMTLQNFSTDVASKSTLAPRESTPTTVCSGVRSILQSSVVKALKALHYDTSKMEHSLCLPCTQKGCSLWHEVKISTNCCYMYCKPLRSKLLVPKSGKYWFTADKTEKCIVEVSTNSNPASQKQFSGRNPDSSVSIGRLTLLKWTDSNGHDQTLRLRDIMIPVWEEVGDLLGLPNYRIEGIHKQDSRDLRLCWRKVVVLWSEMENPSYPWSWDGVLSLLKDLELNESKKELQDALTCLKLTDRGS